MIVCSLLFLFSCRRLYQLYDESSALMVSNLVIFSLPFVSLLTFCIT